ncbi:AraC family transcriptional regulator [Photobacterium lucens]|uniref:AraC family transcriptional regulator n=1 Tax=Photobacterium lucens TaxID=2562949 RepID=UPI0013691180|nr:AraC family transcriptional regulator [Photobacterium lucens]MBP2699607.1 AraC family transcriptional regulator [Vibrio parahaemolyticus]MZG55780.1 AraC family transcriptional regulator [Photobacterium lucens]MZG80716.1 AraC family transcriptional regulator [Photobacterium lucens]
MNEKLKQQLADTAEALCEYYGIADQTNRVHTLLSGVRIFRIDRYHRLTPQMYEQGIVIIFQGNKIGHLNQHQFGYDVERCLIVTTPYPISCETFASPETPLMGINIDLDINVISELVSIMQSEHPYWKTEDTRCGVATSQMTEAMYLCMLELLSILHNPLDTKVLGTALLRRFFYYLLQSDQGYLLAHYCEQDSSLAKIASVLSFIQGNYAQKLNVNDLAEMAGMSVSVFHKVFKQVVTDPPLQYIKKIRLNHAKTHMLQEGLAANLAAQRVGYESAAQFSREFKRYFGVPPSRIDESAGYISGHESNR